ncbi:hypothetical protein SNE40_009372 [Patella caerulea]|uniref:EF-hand domain-containing protein n=1 Tax=Patella caerulea TaxID=87958 RepID=A0AAN8JTE7_PATCE
MRQEVLFLVCCMFATSCCGVFYTTSKDNDYPRIGRRSFFTSSHENTYPRIGRSGSNHVGTLNTDIYKRRFTAGGGSSYPRLGRGGYFKSQGVAYPRIGRSESDSSDEIEDTDDTLPETNDNLPTLNDIRHAIGLQLPIAFLLWDQNADGQLTKSEFITGLSKSRHRHHKN